MERAKNRRAQSQIVKMEKMKVDRPTKRWVMVFFKKNLSLLVEPLVNFIMMVAVLQQLRVKHLKLIIRTETKYIEELISGLKVTIKMPRRTCLI